MKRIDVVYAFITNERDDVLIVKNVGRNTWSLPGGAVENGETLDEAVIRETYEEAGVTIQPEDILSINEAFMSFSQHHALFITFRGRVVSGEVSIQYPEEISEVKWAPRQEAEELLPHYPYGLQKMSNASAVYYNEGLKSV
ncbi:NUDIX hydrolase [Thalassobacillus sp. CUG 92003]|uniref:NUDIX hydrolase n=1 Tax=Thalassobacillus sp. CUG 92003 TaxID=2736641 RepID=UPI0015E7CE47|nr:NUDIX hydrolase [Thalassobacillus sp. CUG 92003]